MVSKALGREHEFKPAVPQVEAIEAEEGDGR